MIHLVDIDPGNWRLKLEVAESQKHYVANSSVMLARAYAYRYQRSRAFVIYDDSGIFQDGQMLTDRCKLHTDSVDKFADTMFRPISELLDDPQPDGVSKSFENLCFFFETIFFVDKHNTPRYSVNIT